MTLTAVHDLTSRIESQQAYETAAAGGPVRYLTQAFIDALQGAWGELTAFEPPRVPVQRSAAR